MIFASLVILAASLAAVISIEAAARGRLGINSLIGLRVASVMSSDQAWRQGHAAARIPVWAGASAATAGSLISLALPESARGVAQTASTALLLLGVVAGGVIAARAAKSVVPPVFEDLPPSDQNE